MALDYYATDLPGKSLYSKEFNVKVRRVTPIEQKYILSLSQKTQHTNKEYIDFVKKIISIDNPEVQFEDLYWFDVIFLLYQIRFTTYQRYPIQLQFTCSECKKEFTHTLDIGSIIPTEPQALNTSIHLTNFGDTPIRQKVMGDDIRIEEFMKELGLDENDYASRVLLLDLCLISNGRTLKEMYKLAENDDITAEDLLEIEKWYTTNTWGIEEKANTICPHCKKEASKRYYLSIEDYFSAI